MKIVVFEAEQWEEDLFEGSCGDQDVYTVTEPLSSSNAEQYEHAEGISTFIHSDLGAETLGKLPALELTATRSTGYDHIDLDYCAERNTAVCNVPSYGDNTVAEHVFALLLALRRKIPEAVDRTRKGDFTMQGLRGHDLRGSTLGVIGTGSIGRHVVRIAKGFGMEVLAFDLKPDEELAGSFDFSYVGFDEILERDSAGSVGGGRAHHPVRWLSPHSGSAQLFPPHRRASGLPRRLRRCSRGLV